MASTNDIVIDQDCVYAEDLTDVYDGKSFSLNSLVLDQPNDPVVKYYICRTDGGGSTITGRPDDSAKKAFILEVRKIRYNSSSDFITKQIYMDTNTSEIWYRTGIMNNGLTWLPWNSLYTTEFKPTASEIGAAASSHNHSAANITSGTLPVSRGGTGITSNPSLLVNLGSTSAASVFATSPRPGVTGTLPIARGGTGATSIGRGLSVSSNQLGHSNAAITASNAGPTANATISPGGSFTVPYITYDGYGHITGRTNRTMTLNSNILDTGNIVTSISGAETDYSHNDVASARLLKHEVMAIYQHWTYCYNNSSSSKTCYIMISGISSGRASLLIFAIGKSSDRCCCRHIKITDYSTEPLQSTMYQGSTSACWNGNKYVNAGHSIVTDVSEAAGVALTNVESYTSIEVFATGTCWIERSYFG